ncbi:hypothetical protein COP2_036154 [Malus domestica]
MVLCSNCKARIVLTKQNERTPQTPTPRQSSKDATTPARKCSIGSTLKNGQTALPWPDDALISTRRFITRIITRVIPAIQVHRRIKKPSGLLSHATNVGTVTTLTLACILHYPNLKNVDASGYIAWLDDRQPRSFRQLNGSRKKR